MIEMKFGISDSDREKVARQFHLAGDAIAEGTSTKVIILEIGPCEIAVEDGMLKIGCTF